MGEVLVAFLVALVFAGILYAILTPASPQRVRGTAGEPPENEAAAVGWAVLFFFFIVLFLAALAGGLWVRPVGPVIGGVSWVPVLIIGFLVALLIAAATPTDRTRVYGRRRDRLGTRAGTPADRTPASEEEAMEDASFAFGMFFWILIIILVVAVAAGFWT